MLEFNKGFNVLIHPIQSHETTPKPCNIDGLVCLKFGLNNGSILKSPPCISFIFTRRIYIYMQWRIYPMTWYAIYGYTTVYIHISWPCLFYWYATCYLCILSNFDLFCIVCYTLILPLSSNDVTDTVKIQWFGLVPMEQDRVIWIIE